MHNCYVNRIAALTPKNDVHKAFVAYAFNQLSWDPRSQRLFERLCNLGGIEHRYSFLTPNASNDELSLDGSSFYQKDSYPTTGERMRLFESFAPSLAKETIQKLDIKGDLSKITHLIVTCCTGMSAPGLDLQIAELCGLPATVERTMVGFMGCYAAITGLKLARHIVRSEPASKILVVNLELCSLHLQKSRNLEQLLSFYLFADGCAASLITSEPQGLSLDSFHSEIASGTKDLITWKVGDSGFEMFLSGQVPCAIRETLEPRISNILRGAAVDEIDLWAIHPGGKSVLDAVQSSFALPPAALAASREVLRQYGNMSSPTVMFVLKALLASAKPGQKGCAMAFGPGLTAETCLFEMAS